MKFLDLSFNGIKNTVSSISLFNISVLIKNKLENNSTKNTDNFVSSKSSSEAAKYSDIKTKLSGLHLNLIDQLKGDLIVYLFIQIDNTDSDYHLVSPTILEESSGKILEYGKSYFAIEGSGGGINNIETLFIKIKTHMTNGNNVHILPLVTPNNYIENFQYFDSGIKIQDLLDNSIDLINYRKGKFENIYLRYQELMTKYQMS